MKCIKCQTVNPDEQNFCSLCGSMLGTGPLHGQAAETDQNKFCGQCGAGLSMESAITLARSGLITHIDQKIADLLGYQQTEMQGKPFSLFVEHADLVIFFSNLNELLSSAVTQSFEIALRHKNSNNIYVQLDCRAGKNASKPIDTVYISLTETTDSHLAAAHLQAQQDLLALIFTVTSDISTVNQEHLGRSIEDALKKICLFTRADRCFIYNMNRPAFRLDPMHEWRQPIASLPGVKVKSKNISLSNIKLSMAKLHQEKKIVTHDISGLPPSEQDELTNWHHTDLKGLICHIIYAGKHPIGIIGVTKTEVDDPWDLDCVSLVKFFGDFIAKYLPQASENRNLSDKSQPTAAKPERARKKMWADAPIDDVDISDIDPELDEELKNILIEPTDHTAAQEEQIILNAIQPMLLEKISDDHSYTENKQSVFPRSDGLVLLTCPHCGIQESVSSEQFDALGNALRVTCPCSNQFNVMLEKRRFFRKSVHLDGYFSLSDAMEQDEASNHTWGPMIVKDISKTGLQFSSRKAKLVNPGDLLMVRFNLDNENQALIHKPARVISVAGNEVGCRFEGDDSYDITLGFYFM